MIHIILANGFEELEALTSFDILTRLGLKVQLISITSNLFVESSHGVTIKADMLYENTDFSNSQAIILPGGMPGAQNLLSYEPLGELLKKQNDQNKLIAAICAAPMVLGDLNILTNKKATCYPGFESHLKSVLHTDALIETDGNIITGKGPGASIKFAFAIAEKFVSAEKIEEVKKQMILL